MKVTITGKNITLTDALKNAIESKFSKFEKYFKHEIEMNVTLEVIKNRQIMESMMTVGGINIRAEDVSDDMYASLDGVVDKLSAQITKYKTKLEKKNKFNETIRFEQIPDYEEENEEIEIVKTKRFPIKPMSAEEAVLQMELLGHNFFVFTNANTDEFSVVYKRKRGQYGLIEPTAEEN